MPISDETLPPAGPPPGNGEALPALVRHMYGDPRDRDNYPGLLVRMSTMEKAVRKLTDNRAVIIPLATTIFSGLSGLANLLLALYIISRGLTP